jgi:hypothetical protein
MIFPDRMRGVGSISRAATGPQMKNFIFLTVAVLSAASFAQSEITSPAQKPAPAEFSAAPGVEIPQPSTDRVLREALAPEKSSDVITDYRIEDLPIAVQETASVVAGRDGYKIIADIDREITAGAVVWEIEFEQEGGNVEIFIDESGILIPEPGLIDFRVSRPATAEPGTNAFGTAPGFQVGHTTSSIRNRWEDLPAAVRKKAAHFGGQESVQDIDREFVNGRVGYEIEFRRDGRHHEITFLEDGTIVESNSPQATPIVHGPARSEATPQTGASPQAGPSAQP